MDIIAVTGSLGEGSGTEISSMLVSAVATGAFGRLPVWLRRFSALRSAEFLAL